MVESHMMPKNQLCNIQPKKYQSIEHNSKKLRLNVISVRKKTQFPGSFNTYKC